MGRVPVGESAREAVLKKYFAAAQNVQDFFRGE